MNIYLKYHYPVRTPLLPNSYNLVIECWNFGKVIDRGTDSCAHAQNLQFKALPEINLSVAHNIWKPLYEFYVNFCTFQNLCVIWFEKQNVITFYSKLYHKHSGYPSNLKKWKDPFSTKWAPYTVQTSAKSFYFEFKRLIDHAPRV